MLPDLSVFWVIFFVLLLAAIVDRLLLRPVTRVMHQREQAIRSAREMADTAAARAEAATAEFEQRTAAARGDVYKQMDDMRRVALERRQHVLAETRAEVEKAVADASDRVKADAEAARQKLRRDAESLGAAAAERILGRQAS
ncbi:MAG: ATP synthase F0 subunit B [Acidobacteria bacterium]|nr:ATP synthase F0 subunit B [Acidobacteriota bacterium]